jgi:hypothetical protein
VKKAEPCVSMNLSVSDTVSKPSSFWTKHTVIVRYLTETSKIRLSLYGDNGYSRFCHGHQCHGPLPINEIIHDIRPHVWCIQIHLKQSMVVAHGDSALDPKCMLHCGIPFLSWCQCTYVKIKLYAVKREYKYESYPELMRGEEGAHRFYSGHAGA